MVDTATSKAAAARREGSTPSWGTMIQNTIVRHHHKSDASNMDQTRQGQPEGATIEAQDEKTCREKPNKDLFIACVSPPTPNR